MLVCASTVTLIVFILYFFNGEEFERLPFVLFKFSFSLHLFFPLHLY